MWLTISLKLRESASSSRLPPFSSIGEKFPFPTSFMRRLKAVSGAVVRRTITKVASAASSQVTMPSSRLLFRIKEICVSICCIGQKETSCMPNRSSRQEIHSHFFPLISREADWAEAIPLIFFKVSESISSNNSEPEKSSCPF